MTDSSRESRRPSPLDRRSLVRRAGALLAMAVAVPVVTACRLIAARADDRYTVRMTSDRQFEPATLTIPVGGTVVWDNQGTRRHGVTTDASALEGGAAIALPDNVAPFTSPELTAGETWRLRFNVPGTYVYVCPYHYRENMIGSIVVEEA